MRTLTRAQAKLRPFATAPDVTDTVLRLWREAGYREERYAAIALLDTPAARRLRDPAVLPTLQELIVTGAWWDYVDELAHRVGDLLLGWPAEVRPAVLTWTRSDDRWLRRTSVICQLGARDRADVELLTIAIESAIGDGDFFLRPDDVLALVQQSGEFGAVVLVLALEQRVRHQDCFELAAGAGGVAGLRANRPGLGAILRRNPRTEPAVVTRGAETPVVSTHRRTRK